MADDPVIAERGVFTASTGAWKLAARQADVIGHLAGRRVVGLDAAEAAGWSRSRTCPSCATRSPSSRPSWQPTTRSATPTGLAGSWPRTGLTADDFLDAYAQRAIPAQ